MLVQFPEGFFFCCSRPLRFGILLEVNIFAINAPAPPLEFAIKVMQRIHEHIYCLQ